MKSTKKNSNLEPFHIALLLAGYQSGTRRSYLYQRTTIERHRFTLCGCPETLYFKVKSEKCKMKSEKCKMKTEE